MDGIDDEEYPISTTRETDPVTLHETLTRVYADGCTSVFTYDNDGRLIGAAYTGPT